MEDSESNNFCISCGAPLRDSDMFCSVCGATKGSYPGPSGSYYQNSQPKSSGKLTVIAILSILWALAALGFGLYCVLGAESIVDTIFYDFGDMFYELGYTYDEMVNALVVEGAIIAASGAFAALTAALALAKRSYAVALIACIISSVLGLVVLVGLVGFIVVYLIYKAKDEFGGNRTTI